MSGVAQPRPPAGRPPGDPANETTASPSDDRTGSGLGQQAVAGVLWMTAQKWIVRLLGLVTIAVLTRLLAPEDFGMVAAAGTVLPFLYLLSDLGFASYIVQADRPDQRLLSTGFWFSMAVGSVLGVGLVAVAPGMGAVFGDVRVVPVLQVLALSVVWTSAASVPTALLRRAMRFRAVAGATAAGAALGQVAAIVLAVGGWGVWALVAQTLTGQAVTCVAVWILARWRPARSLGRREFVTMARFGVKVLGVEVVAALRAWGEAAIVTNVLGLAALGYLTIAQRLVQIVQDLTGSALVPVTQVAFARVRDSADRLRGAYLRALRLTYAVMALPLTLVAVAAPVLVPLVFGDGWAPSLPVAQLLALAATLTIGASLDHGLFYGLGRPGRWFVYALAVDALTLTATALAAPHGLVAVAGAFGMVALGATIVRWPLVGRLLGAPARQVARPFGLLVVTVAASGLAGLGTLSLLSSWPSWLALLLVGSVVLLVNLAVVRLMAPGVFTEIGRLLARLIRASRRPRTKKRLP